MSDDYINEFGINKMWDIALEHIEKFPCESEAEEYGIKVLKHVVSSAKRRESVELSLSEDQTKKLSTLFFSLLYENNLYALVIKKVCNYVGLDQKDAIFASLMVEKKGMNFQDALEKSKNLTSYVSQLKDTLSETGEDLKEILEDKLGSELKDTVGQSFKNLSADENPTDSQLDTEHTKVNKDDDGGMVKDSEHSSDGKILDLTDIIDPEDQEPN